MIDHALYVLTLAAALGAGLIAGVFFAFSAFVMKALARLAPAEGIAAMQSINVVVLNPWFFAAFFGTAIVCLPLAVAGVWFGRDPQAWLLLAGAALYLVGTILVTIVCNVPRNDALAAVDAGSEEGAHLWRGYVAGWTAWNHVRTVASLAAAAAFTVALA